MEQEGLVGNVEERLGNVSHELAEPFPASSGEDADSG
jgi:hypothetical protein